MTMHRVSGKAFMKALNPNWKPSKPIPECKDLETFSMAVLISKPMKDKFQLLCVKRKIEPATLIGLLIKHYTETSQ